MFMDEIRMNRDELWQKVNDLASDSTLVKTSISPQFRIVGAKQKGWNEREITIEYIEPYRLTIDWEDIQKAYNGSFDYNGTRIVSRRSFSNRNDSIISTLDERIVFVNGRLVVEHNTDQKEQEKVEQSKNDGIDDDYDDWAELIDDSGGRTPNDDRSDSMNPNSHRYNPGK
tara:strand:- start:515 stop:1027 length:513 start_codon:yes stop_codon:yes gene_type:complete